MKSSAFVVVIGVDVHTVPYPFPITPVIGFEGLNGLAVFAPETPKAIREIAVGPDIVTVITAFESELLAMVYHSSM